jgi:methylenetetrahydrofolate reductase (NADPH)
MTRISVELVPRDEARLREDAAAVRTLMPGASLLNVPDLTRFPLRAWDAAALLRGEGFADVIPHIRAIDIAPGAPLPGADDPDLREVLVVAGDPPADPAQRVWPNTATDIIGRYRRELPHLAVYAAFDPYRRAPQHELSEIARKRDAGACGFFTQPLFDRAMLDICMSWLRDETVFWGLSPVIGPKSRAYWERTNRVVFPGDFEPTIEANIAFAQDVLRVVRERGDSAYLMPLRVKLENYLPPLQDVLQP